MKTMRERLEEKYQVEPNSGCWIWTAATTPQGYGRFGLTGSSRAVPAHRVVYELFVGPIPKGMQLDHLCRLPACVNPAHLQPVSIAENYRRSPLTNQNKAACWRGHPFTPENTYIRKDRPGRLCLACHNERQSRRWHGLEPIRKPKKEALAKSPRKTILDRFEAKVQLEEGSECWIWTAARGQDTGYGVFQVAGKYRSAHRVSYELFVGPIPPKQVIHHKCGRRECVNPQHLEATTQRGNLMATPTTQAARNVAKVVCIRGHEAFVTDRTGRRYCKECNRLKQRAFRSRHKEA